jgi:biopolymer transport protein ExbB/TolQ
MIGSESLVALVTVGSTVAGAVTSLLILLQSASGLRAKKRAQRYVRERTRVDASLASIRQHAKKEQLSPEEVASAMKSIEAAISSSPMSETDKNYIHEGLHQDSPNATKRYVGELLKWAS